jgi:hypothetical protein
MISRRLRPWVCSRSTSILATKAVRLAPALPVVALTASCSERAGRARRVLQLLDAARADAARREVDHAQEAGVVVRVLQQAQVGQRVLDFGALEEAQAAVHAVRHAGVEQRRLDHPALRVAAVEHGDLLARNARLGALVAHQVAHLLDHPLRLGQVGRRLVHAHRLARALVGAQVLAQARLVVADQRVGRIEDVAVAAVVLLQLDLVRTSNSRTKSAMLPTRAPRKA